MSLAVPKKLKAALKDLAAKDRRKLSDYVRLQLEDIVLAEEQAAYNATKPAKGGGVKKEDRSSGADGRGASKA